MKRFFYKLYLAKCAVAHRKDIIKRHRTHSPKGGKMRIETFGGLSTWNLLYDLHYYQSRLDACIEYIKFLEKSTQIKVISKYGIKGE